MNCVEGLTWALGKGRYGGAVVTAAAAAAKLVIAVLSSARLVVTGTAVMSSAVRPVKPSTRLSNSRRANASRPQINGAWAGVFGAAPASGFNTQLITLDTTLATAVTGFGVGA